jgi:hypothetical protein
VAGGRRVWKRGRDGAPSRRRWPRPTRGEIGEAEVDGSDDGLQRREATNGGRHIRDGGEAAASLPLCYALRSIHAVHVFPSSHHGF